MHRSLWLNAGLWLLGLTAGSCGGPTQNVASPAAFVTYPIKLHRPAKVGDAMYRSTSLTASQTSTIKKGQEVLEEQTNTLTAVFEGPFEVLAVDDTGTATKTAYTVDRCTVTTQAGISEVLSKGTVFTVTRGAEHPFEIEGGKCPRKQRTFSV